GFAERDDVGAFALRQRRVEAGSGRACRPHGEQVGEERGGAAVSNGGRRAGAGSRGFKYFGAARYFRGDLRRGPGGRRGEVADRAESLNRQQHWANLGGLDGLAQSMVTRVGSLTGDTAGYSLAAISAGQNACVFSCLSWSWRSHRAVWVDVPRSPWSI